MPYVVYLVPLLATALLLRQIRDSVGARRRAFIALWALALAAGCVTLARFSTGRGTPFGDFDKAYYHAGRVVLSSPGAIYDCGHVDRLCFVNIPIVAVAFAPLGALSTHASHVVMTIVGVASVVLAIWLLGRLINAQGIWWYGLATAVLLNGPLYYSLRLANLTHVILVLLVAALLALRAGRPGTAGALLAICALIKPPFMLFLPYLAWRARFRVAALSFAATLGATAVVSLLWFGPELHWLWLSQYVGGTSSNPIGAYNAQSISGMLVRMTTSAHLVDWVGVPVGRAIRAAILTLTGCVLATALLACWKGGAPRSWDDALDEVGVVLCTMLLVSPVTWTHYYCFLLVPLCAIARHRARWLTDSGVLCAALVCAAVLISLPVALWIPPHPFFGPVIARGLLSHYVVGGALLLVTLCALRIGAISIPLAEKAAA